MNPSNDGFDTTIPSPGATRSADLTIDATVRPLIELERFMDGTP